MRKTFGAVLTALALTCAVAGTATATQPEPTQPDAQPALVTQAPVTAQWHLGGSRRGY